MFISATMDRSGTISKSDRMDIIERVRHFKLFPYLEQIKFAHHPCVEVFIIALT